MTIIEPKGGKYYITEPKTAKTPLDWDINKITQSLVKTMTEYASQDSLKVYEHQYGAIDSQIKKLEEMRENLCPDCFMLAS